MNITLGNITIQTESGTDFLSALDALIQQYDAEKASIIRNISHKCPYNGQGKSAKRFSSFLDGLKTAEAVHYIAAALRKEGIPEAQVRAALLSICGVNVDAPLVRLLMNFE